MPKRHPMTFAASAATATALAALLPLLASAGPQPGTPPSTAGLASAPVQAAGPTGGQAYDGVVQAVRQTVIAAQVSGAVVALDVKAGDTVRPGQVLLRLDARAADQTAAAGAAQVQAARAAQEAATREWQRQQQLFHTGYISRAALDTAEAQYKSTQATAEAQLASAGAARTQSGF
jgi:membrane fusion protein, multidrug efflux system